MAEKKALLRRKISGAAQAAPPSGVRIRHRSGNGLWVFEDAAGQTYLAMKQPDWGPENFGPPPEGRRIVGDPDWPRRQRA